MKQNLLVTLADKNYIDQAKQLFSSAYWNAGWAGDYMLLAHDVPDDDLKWFSDKGILIKKCEVFDVKGREPRLAVLLSKFNLFANEIKRWRNVIYLDADMIVRASLDGLLKIKGFAAVPGFNRLSKVFLTPIQMKIRGIPKKSFDSLKIEYDLNSPSFKVGLMAFSTDIINDGTLPKLKKLLELYGKITVGCEGIFNLLFYGQWTGLPRVYCVNPYNLRRLYNIPAGRIDGIVLHSYDRGPWCPENYFHDELQNNLNRADMIDLERIPKPVKQWTEQAIREYISYVKKNRIKYLHKYLFMRMVISMRWFIDISIGLVGIFLKNNLPKLYSILKRSKNE